MTDQENQNNHTMIRRYGCYLLSIIWLCAKERRCPQNSDEINQFYRDLMNNGMKDIADDCTVEDPAAVFKMLGVKVEQVRTPAGGIAMPVTDIVTNGFEILCYNWPEKGFTHFCAGDGNGNLVYDPIHRGSNTVKNGKLVSKRLFRRI